MAQITTRAIVISAIPYLDNHKMLTLFSPDFGKLTAVAHGCRGTKSKLRACAVPFASGEYVLSGKRERLNVVSCQPDSEYHAAMEDYDAITHAAYLCQLCGAVVQQNQPNEGLYAILLKALAHLHYGSCESAAAFCAALLWMLDELGFAPEINACALCGAQKGSPRFSPADGGLCCKKCAPEAPPIAREHLAFLRAARLGGSAVPTISTALAGSLKPLLTSYCEYCIDRRLKSSDLIK